MNPTAAKYIMAGNFAELPTEVLDQIAESSGESLCWLLWLHDPAFKRAFEPLRFREIFIDRREKSYDSYLIHEVDLVHVHDESTYMFDRLQSVDDLPAISIEMVWDGLIASKYNVWCHRGEIHRVDGPAVSSSGRYHMAEWEISRYNKQEIDIWKLAEEFNGCTGEVWVRHGVPFRCDGPAISTVIKKYHAVDGKFMS